MQVQKTGVLLTTLQILCVLHGSSHTLFCESPTENAPAVTRLSVLQWRRMASEHEIWLDRVRDALRSINMSMDDWQPVWPFDFIREYEKGTDPDVAAMKANRFWWYRQNNSRGCECDKVPGCWLPREHHGECQPEYQAGDHIKVEFEGEGGMPGEWMWLIVRSQDDTKRIVYGILDNEPINDYPGKLAPGSELAVSYDRIRAYRESEHSDR